MIRHVSGLPRVQIQVNYYPVLLSTLLTFQFLAFCHPLLIPFTCNDLYVSDTILRLWNHGQKSYNKLLFLVASFTHRMHRRVFFSLASNIYIPVLIPLHILCPASLDYLTILKCTVCVSISGHLVLPSEIFPTSFPLPSSLLKQKCADYAFYLDGQVLKSLLPNLNTRIPQRYCKFSSRPSR